MYRNLRAEMIKQNVTIQDIADALNLKADTVRLKLKGKVGIDVDEVKAICALFEKDNAFSYLFAN